MKFRKKTIEDVMSIGSSGSGSNDDSIETLLSDSSLLMNKTYDHSYSSRTSQTVKDQSVHKRKPSGRCSSKKSIRSCSARNKAEQRVSSVLPFFKIPADEAGIMWSGTFRRVPVFIFTLASVIKKSDFVEKLGRTFNMTFKLIRTECKLLRCILQSHGFQESTSQFGEFNILWTGCHLKPYQLRILSDFHKVNHFPRSYELTRKDRLAKNIQKMQQLKGYQNFDFVPRSFILPEEYNELYNDYLQEKCFYIVKPIASSRGRGIYLIKNPEEVNQEEPVIVSRYITNPLLLDGFKFDVRLYVAVTSYQPLILYIYEEGLVRFATVKYQIGRKHLKSQCMHLTNYSVNKKNFEFVHNDDADVEDFGNKWSLGALLRYLHSQGMDVTGLMLRIEDIVLKSFLCALKPINAACNMFPACKTKCFELYGFDIIIDENLRPWLLEVNLSPSLACDSPLDFKVKSHMLTDLFNLVGIVCHDPTRRTQGSVNGIHVMANGNLAIPPDSPTCFISANDLMFRNLSNTSKFSKKLNYSKCRLLGLSVSELIPKGMTATESNILRRLAEEACRAGGWIRLYPNPEAWEQYAHLWPSDNIMHRTKERDSLNNDNYSSFLSVSTRLKKDEDSMLSSAYSAAFAAYVLQATSTAILKANLISKDGEFLKDETKFPEFCSNYHPNTAPAVVDLNCLLLSNSNYYLIDPQDREEYCIRTPNSASVKHSNIPLHSITPMQMRNCLASISNLPAVSCIPIEQSRRVTNCYKCTLTHMPQFLRKLDKPPENVTGVCVTPSCSHDKQLEDNSCGIFSEPHNLPTSYSNETSEKSVSENHSFEKIDKSGDVAFRYQSSSCTSSTHSNQTENTRVPATHSKNKSPTIYADISKLTQTQARHTFSAYLTRIQNRLITEVSQCSSKYPVRKSQKIKENEQIDLMVRFLRKASKNLNPKSVRIICGFSVSSDKINPFPVCIPDQKVSLNERKIALAKLLNKFIEVYDYETVTLGEQNVISDSQKHDKKSAGFWKFIKKASEQELESLLSQYARFHHSVDIFLGYDCNKSTRFDNYNNKLNGLSCKRNSKEYMNCNPSAYSTDSGFVSSDNLKSKINANKSLINNSKYDNQYLDNNINYLKNLTKMKGDHSPQCYLSESDQMMSWSRCCHSFKKSSTPNNLTYKNQLDITTNKKSSENSKKPNFSLFICGRKRSSNVNLQKDKSESNLNKCENNSFDQFKQNLKSLTNPHSFDKNKTILSTTDRNFIKPNFNNKTDNFSQTSRGYIRTIINKRQNKYHTKNSKSKSQPHNQQQHQSQYKKPQPLVYSTRLNMKSSSGDLKQSSKSLQTFKQYPLFQRLQYVRHNPSNSNELNPKFDYNHNIYSGLTNSIDRKNRFIRPNSNKISSITPRINAIYRPTTAPPQINTFKQYLVNNNNNEKNDYYYYNYINDSDTRYHYENQRKILPFSGTKIRLAT